MSAAAGPQTLDEEVLQLLRVVYPAQLLVSALYSRCQLAHDEGQLIEALSRLIDAEQITDVSAECGRPAVQIKPARLPPVRARLAAVAQGACAPPRATAARRRGRGEACAELLGLLARTPLTKPQIIDRMGLARAAAYQLALRLDDQGLLRNAQGHAALEITDAGRQWLSSWQSRPHPQLRDSGALGRSQNPGSEVSVRPQPPPGATVAAAESAPLSECQVKGATKLATDLQALCRGHAFAAVLTALAVVAVEVIAEAADNESHAARIAVGLGRSVAIGARERLLSHKAVQ